MIPVEVHAPGTGSAPDVVVDLAENVTIGEVFDALALPPHTMVDGAVMSTPASTPAHQVLRSGSELQVTRVPSTSAPVEGFVDLAVVAGLDAGAIVRLQSGLFLVSTAESGRHDRWVFQVDDRQPILGQPMAWHERGHSIEAILGVSGPMLAIGGPVDPEPARSDAEGQAAVVHRPPRHIAVAEPRPVVFDDVPDRAREPSPLSWATLLAPIPIAVMMAFFFRPIFALFAAMGPIMALGRWWESRRRFQRETAERDQQLARMRAELSDQLVEQSEAEARRRWSNHPHVGALRQRAAMGSVRLWQRRPGDSGFMQATIGVGPASCPIVMVDKSIPPELTDMLDTPLLLRSVPHVVDLSIDAAVGIVGSRPHTLAVARSLVAQMVTAHGPADLRIGVLCTPQNAQSWDWLKWLPHIDDQLVSHDALAIAATMAPMGTRERLGVTDQASSRPVKLVIVDAPGADVAAVVRAAAEAEVELRCIALAPEPTVLPAVCSTLCQVAGNDLVVDATRLPGPPARLTPTGVSLATIESWARSLAKFRDPEMTSSATGPSRNKLSFLEMVGHRSAQGLAQHWAQRPADATPAVVLGEGPSGLFQLDLTADGPHALIAGTTGSGKSELLRTLVVGLAAECPPEQLNLVLVDFKGGGAFDVVSDLPHVVGLITDLDETLVTRALVSLRAELERRERLFRDLAVSTFEQAVALPMTAQTPTDLARLVIVIDEFAALATDYGDLMSGIVDLAARGRSLGMHLVLATQRPSGVVDQKIRANTNIRIALRVQDEFDSQDVVGTTDAAKIDRRAPGRAFVRVGGDRPVGVQMAFSGGRDTRSQRFLIRPYRLFDHDEPAETLSETDDCLDGADRQTELQTLVRTIVQASASQEAAARPLWAPPLPEHLDWIDLGSRELAATPSTSGYALGLADIPERQTQTPWRWDPALGALGIFGASGSDAGKALVSLAAAMALAATPETLHLYIIDGHAGASSVLESLPHTGAYIRSDETDRANRVIRLFESTLGQRRIAPHVDDPKMVLLVDNLAAVLATHDEVEASLLNDRLAALARDGAALGIHLAIAARTPRDIPHRLAQQIPNRLVMDLADPNGFLALGLRLRDVVPLPPMRAIDARTKDVIQLVEPPDMTSLISADGITNRVAPLIHSFPTCLHVDDLDGATIDRNRVIAVPVGVEAVDLGPALLMLRPGEHVLVVATPGMGRSTTTETIARQLGRCNEPVATVHVRPQQACGDSLRELATTDQITVVLVDDAEALGAEVTQALEGLTKAANPWVRIVAATRPEAARSMRSWIAGIRASGTGLLIGGTAADGDLFRVRLGSLDGRGTIPGRASLIDRGRVIEVQLASPTDAN